MRTDFKKKIEDNMYPDPNSGCWLWGRYIDYIGYGKTTGFGETLAHRVSYRAFVGQIPEGMEIDHRCKNKSCVNPKHLEAVTHTENMRRTGADFGKVNRQKTHCKRGHEYTLENTRVQVLGSLRMRKCKACYPFYKKKKKLTRALYNVEILET